MKKFRQDPDPPRAVLEATTLPRPWCATTILPRKPHPHRAIRRLAVGDLLDVPVDEEDVVEHLAALVLVKAASAADLDLGISPVAVEVEQCLAGYAIAVRRRVVVKLQPGYFRRRAR